MKATYFQLWQYVEICGKFTTSHMVTYDHITRAVIFVTDHICAHMNLAVSFVTADM